uniref:Kinase non-catalytic C-lobe domain containing 1 n=1 Tax=Sphenodon punctatus TaxID=8508 RepID=A0A8D0L9N1_SPHPU
MKCRVIYKFVSWQENVSLADILSLRDSCLTELDIWATCLECSHSMKSIAHSAIFQTLCITPDTLAFNTNGNVCFMEQLSDDPEGAFVPPEFDITGNTFEAHIYSLGATLRAAIEYVIEPETEAVFGQDLQTLLEQMQEENPDDRPDIESIISLCEEKLKFASSSNICRNLSAVGRRVLSIESFSAFQESTTTHHRDSAKVLNDREYDLRERQISLDDERFQYSQLASPAKKNKEEDNDVKYNNETFASSDLDTQQSAKDLDREIFKKSCLRKMKTLPKLPFETTDTSNVFTSVTNNGPLIKKNKSIPESLSPDNNEVASLKGKLSQCNSSNSPRLKTNSYVSDLHLEATCVYTQVSGIHLKEHMSSYNGKKDFLSCNPIEECSHIISDIQNKTNILDQSWVSLKHLLSQNGKPLKDYELWALCHECLVTLQTYIDFPVSLCLDSVLIDCQGNVLFASPKDEGKTIKLVCIYCVAAILWRAAKYNFPPDHKLALPRKLKNLLLDMAKRNPEERPSLVDVIKICGSYLLEKGINGKKVLALLSKASVYAVFIFYVYLLDFGLILFVFLGFVPITNKSKIIAVKGPVPCPIPLNDKTCLLPDAFTSPATHFKPIILQQNPDTTKAVEKEEDIDNKNSHFVSDTESRAVKDGVVAVGQPTPEILEQDTCLSNLSPQMSPVEQNPSNMVSATVKCPLLSDSSHNPQEKNTVFGNSSSSDYSIPPGTPLINNFIHKQDPETRVLTLVPVQLAVSEQITNKPLYSKMASVCYPSSPGLLSDRRHLENEKCNSDVDSHSSISGHTSHASVDQNTACLISAETLIQNNRTNDDLLLQKVVHLIQEEFAFDGYLENGVEDLAMGNYIFTLKDLTFSTFCNAISEKFCDLYWDEKLLENLYKAVNGDTPGTKQTPRLPGLGRMKMRDTAAVPVPNTTLAEMDLDEFSQDNSEKEFRLQKIIRSTEKEGSFLHSSGYCLSLHLIEEPIEQEDTATKIDGSSYSMSPYPADFHSCPGWSSAFYGSECFSLEVHDYETKLGKQKARVSQSIDELDQLLMIETKNYRKSITFYRKLLQKERKNKGCEVKTMLPKLRAQLQEMKSKLQFLEVVKKYLQIMYAEQWGVELCTLPIVVNISRSEMQAVSPLDLSSLLFFYNINKHQNNNQDRSRNLQAGTPVGLMAYLYSRNALLEGYVQQFLYTFRYFCTPEEFLQFLLDRIRSTLPSASLDLSSPLTKIYNRSVCILQAWIEDCYSVDFAINADLLCTLKHFITSKIVPLNGYGKQLLSLLKDTTGSKYGTPFQCYSLEEWEEGNAKSFKKLSEDVSRKSFNWKLSKGNGPITPHQRDRPYTIASAIPKPCYNNLAEEFSGFYARADGGSYFLAEYSSQQLCSQLTLLQQEMFRKCHPVHFLNSRVLGVKDKSVSIQKAVSSESLALKVSNLFLPNCIQDKYLVELLRNADHISTWVAAEIVTSHNSKMQVNLLSKFLLIAKSCYEQRNFATAMQILKGLENLIVRQLPAWKILPSKVSEIMEELKAVEVFLKSDNLCLMEGERFKTLPTIPSACVLAMHIQQLETGGFTMTNGAYKWTKLRNIAKVVSQVHAFQENPYTFTSDLKLQACLKQRIAYFNDADISALAADNHVNFHQIPAEKHSRKIQDTLRRMKAAFQ